MDKYQSFHYVKAVNRPTVANAGFASGTTIWKNVRSSPAPSIRAASISVKGISAKKLFIKKTCQGMIKYGRISANILSLK